MVKFISWLYKCLLWNLWPSKHGSRCHFYSCISEFKWYIARTFFSHNGGLICILNIRGTFFGNVNKQIQFLHIFPFPMIPIKKKNKGGVRGPYLRTALIVNLVNWKPILFQVTLPLTLSHNSMASKQLLFQHLHWSRKTYYKVLDSYACQS